MPKHARVVSVAVQLSHRGDDVFHAAALVDDAAEVAQVLLSRGDRVWSVSGAYVLVPGTTICGLRLATVSRLAIQAFRLASSVSAVIMWTPL